MNNGYSEEKHVTWRKNLVAKGLVQQLQAIRIAFNVDGTKNEVTPDWAPDDWDEYWSMCTGQNRTGQVCSCCDSALTADTRVGAHIRFYGEPEDDHAWIALCCKSCNNSDRPLFVKKGSWVVRAKMSAMCLNARTGNV